MPSHLKTVAQKEFVNRTFSTYNILIFHFIAVAVPYYRHGTTDTTLKMPLVKIKCPATRKRLPKQDMSTKQFRLRKT